MTFRNKSMHILISANSAWNILNFRRSLVNALVADGNRVTVLAPSDDCVKGVEGLGCRFLPLEMRVKGLNPFEEFKLMRRFARIFHAERPDIVLSYTVKNNIFGAMAAKSCKVPFVPNVTGLGTAFLSGGPLWKIVEGLYRRTFAQLPIIFFQNEDDRELFVMRRLVRSVERTRLLPGSGVDLEKFSAVDYPAKTGAPILLMIARLLRNKGVIEYVEAARRTKGRFPKARFQLLGPAECESRTAIDADIVKGWQAEGVIEYLGATTDVRPYIERAHCVVLPSHGGEGTPRALIEAAAMARPLITTDVPGNRSVVDQEETGLLCEARNGSSLTDACCRFLALPHTNKVGMGRSGRAKMEVEYDEAIVTAAYRQAIAELTTER